jgi:hypothetical protein
MRESGNTNITYEYILDTLHERNVQDYFGDQTVTYDELIYGWRDHNEAREHAIIDSAYCSYVINTFTSCTGMCNGQCATSPLTCAELCDNEYPVIRAEVEAEINRLEETLVYPKDANAFLESVGSAPLKNRASLAELMKRPEVTYENLAAIDADRPELSSHALAQLEVQIKYEGYISKQLAQIERFKKLETKALSEDMDYSEIEGLRIEAMQKLNQLKPRSVGQASRISGVSPADINVLLVHLEKLRRKR